MPDRPNLPEPTRSLPLAVEIATCGALAVVAGALTDVPKSPVAAAESELAFRMLVGYVAFGMLYRLVAAVWLGYHRQLLRGGFRGLRLLERDRADGTARIEAKAAEARKRLDAVGKLLGEIEASLGDETDEQTTRERGSKSGSGDGR